MGKFTREGQEPRPGSELSEQERAETNRVIDILTTFTLVQRQAIKEYLDTGVIPRPVEQVASQQAQTETREDLEFKGINIFWLYEAGGRLLVS